MEGVLSEGKDLLGEIGLYNFQGGGKMLRPLIYLLSLESLKTPISDSHVENSVIYELIHMASLLHDDIIDLSSTRRNRKAAHLVYGVPETVLAGDYLASKAGMLSVRTGSLEFMSNLQGHILELSLGELKELEERFNSDLTEEEYFDIIRKKTGVLFTAAANGAAILAGADTKSTESLCNFAINYGLSFQIIDDILDFVADPSVLGKPVLQDQLEGRITLPFILAKKNLNGDICERLGDLGKKTKKDPEDLDVIKDLVIRGKGVDLAREIAGKYLTLALDSLLNLPNSQKLSQMAKDSLHRTS
ncbi:MAG: polyprenyl synthetase family protein [Deltaproteobacteria bacterium]|nr:polyprenyl synthetase family protein [Deltaproteobacteria bacterium]